MKKLALFIIVSAFFGTSIGAADAAPAHKSGVAKVTHKAAVKKHAKKPAKKHRHAHRAKRD